MWNKIFHLVSFLLAAFMTCAMATAQSTGTMEIGTIVVDSGTSTPDVVYNQDWLNAGNSATLTATNTLSIQSTVAYTIYAKGTNGGKMHCASPSDNLKNSMQVRLKYGAGQSSIKTLTGSAQIIWTSAGSGVRTGDYTATYTQTTANSVQDPPGSCIYQITVTWGFTSSI